MKTLVQLSAVLTVTTALILGTRTPAAAQDLVYDAAEGGWVDTKQNLVWGFDFYIVSVFGPDQTVRSWGEPEPVDYYTAELLAANYPEFLASRGWYDAAIIAAEWEAEGYAWRQPTITEAKSAHKRGLLGNEIGQWDLYVWRWTTSTSRDGSDQYVIDLDLNRTYLAARDWPSGYPLFVRRWR